MVEMNFEGRVMRGKKFLHPTSLDVMGVIVSTSSVCVCVSVCLSVCVCVRLTLLGERTDIQT